MLKEKEHSVPEENRKANQKMMMGLLDDSRIRMIPSWLPSEQILRITKKFVRVHLPSAGLTHKREHKTTKAEPTLPECNIQSQMRKHQDKIC